ncbi:MAG: hypothetical protein ACRC33_09660 [Gemmataceae bacterium]
MSEVVGPKDRRRWRTWLLRAGLVVMMLGAAGVINLWWRLSSEYAEGKEALAAAVAELDADDPGWRWDEIEAGRDPIPDEQNSALAVKRVTEALGGWKVSGLQRPDRQPLLRPDAALNRKLDDEALGLLRAGLGGVEPGVTLAVRLKDYPGGHTVVRLAVNPLETLLPHVERVQAVAALLELDAERSLAAGRLPDVADRVRAILRAGAALRGDGFMISALVRGAVRQRAVRAVARMLGTGLPSDAVCVRLAADLEAERAENLLLPAVRGERAAGHALCQAMAAGKVHLAGLFDTNQGQLRYSDWAVSRVYTYRVPEDNALLLRRMTEACGIARLPPSEQPAAWDEFEAEILGSRPLAKAEARRIVAHTLIPGMKKHAEAMARDAASLACAATALAAERYRLAHGRWPAALADLMPRFLPEVPADPFTGEPIVLARHAEGIVLYSVGADGKDDGGAVDQPEAGQPPDLGVRMFEPASRGLPAVAK